MCVGAAIAFTASIVNRTFKLGLLSRMAEQVTFVLIPPLALIFLVLGTIFLGVATPTEALPTFEQLQESLKQQLGGGK